MIAETFDHDGAYRGAHILPCPQIPAGLSSTLGLLNDDVTNLVRWAYQAGRDKAAADVAEMNEQLTKNTLGAQRKIVILEAALRPFAHCFRGDLSAIGGGTLVTRSLPLQRFKDAKAALQGGQQA